MRVWTDDEKKFKQLINILRDPMTNGKIMDVHTHDFVEIEYVLSGSGVQIINDVEYEVKRGDIIYLKRGDCHSYRTNEQMEILNVIFYYSVFEEMSNILQNYTPEEEIDFPKVIHTSGADMFYIEDLLLKAEKEFDEAKAGYYHILKSYLTVFLIYLWRIASDSQLGQNYKMPLIMEYIDRNYTNICINDVAAYFGYSDNYFSKFFKRNIGITFVEYVNRKRLNKAVELLVASDMTVDAICTELGFNDRKHFYDMFKKHMGTTPGALRRHKGGAL